MKKLKRLSFILAAWLPAVASAVGEAGDSAWGEPFEGVSVRLREDKTNWTTNEIPTFKVDLHNQGQREFYAVRSQETGRLEVDGVWYGWTGGFDLKGSGLPPGREYHDIPVNLGSNWKATPDWHDKAQAAPPQIPLKLLPGKHTIRFAVEIRDITVKPKPQNNYVPSNPVEIEISNNQKELAEPAVADPVGKAGDSEWPKGATLEVQLSLSATVGTSNAVKISGNLLVKNPSAAPLTIQNPRNRLVLAFLVFDPLGNPVAPTFLGKADPGFDRHALSSRASYTHHFEGLDFVTGSAWLNYDLSPGKTYKVVAVYRPAGPGGPGFASQEVSLELDSVVHQAVAKSTPTNSLSALQYQQIRVGMSRDEVYQLLGKPQGSIAQGVKDVISEIWVAPPDGQGQKIRLAVLFWADGRVHQVEQDILK